MEEKTAEESSSPTQVRVMLWFIPRTLSTAITKCLSFVDGIQIIFEPYLYAYYYGPERKQTGVSEMYDNFLDKTNDAVTDKVDLAKGFIPDTCTYDWVKQTLEADYPGKKIVFCKDASYTLDGQYDRLPQGYRHTFIIRHPYKLYTSWRRLVQRFLQLQEPFYWHELPEPIRPAKYGLEEHYELYQYLINHGMNPIIIDADDLQRHPESIMRKYCAAVGIPFTEDLLQWPSGDDILHTWMAPDGLIQGNKLGNEGGFYDVALQSTCFGPPRETPSRASLREDVRYMSDASMPFYEKMYNHRIKP
ncbi:uncharacterized protein [Amphiura filiformis]|uniref:uncharacterized protein n=1 Tax=Amphiura filiformis TaxID=82378 RepID=UPI003B2123A9